MRARFIWQVVGVGFVVGLVTASASGRTLIDMPAPKGADVTYVSENATAGLGAVALNRYGYGRVTPLYSYRSPVWPAYGSYRRVGYPCGFGYGFGFGWGRGWSWRSGWPCGYGGRYVIGSRTLRGFRFRSARSSW